MRSARRGRVERCSATGLAVALRTGPRLAYVRASLRKASASRLHESCRTSILLPPNLRRLEIRRLGPRLRRDGLFGVMIVAGPQLFDLVRILHGQVHRFGQVLREVEELGRGGRNLFLLR